jgi:hypothetical protein
VLRTSSKGSMAWGPCGSSGRACVRFGFGSIRPRSVPWK